MKKNFLRIAVVAACLFTMSTTASLTILQCDGPGFPGCIPTVNCTTN